MVGLRTSTNARNSAWARWLMRGAPPAEDDTEELTVSLGLIVKRLMSRRTLPTPAAAEPDGGEAERKSLSA